jgi:hypothetical protein
VDAAGGEERKRDWMVRPVKKRRVLQARVFWLLVLLCIFTVPEVKTVDAADDALPTLPRGILAIHLETYKSSYRIDETTR